MNLQTFKAPTMAEALNQVKRAMGHDAVILHTRTFSHREWLGLRRREVVEITAGQGLRVQQRKVKSAMASPSVGPGAYNNKLIAPAKSAQPTLPGPSGLPAIKSPSFPGQQLLESPAVGTTVILNLSQEITGLKSVVKDLVASVQHQKCPQVPEDLFEYYLQLIESQVADELATDIIKTLQKQVRPEHLANPEFVREKLAEQIERLLPTAGAITRTKKVGPHVVALIGPTGVGKTTTIAKLAANLKLREKHKVGLITIDTYRIAAIDQLKKYADIIGSPLKVVSSAEDLRDAIVSMSDCEFVLIDTAGRSPKDTLKLNELRTFLDAANPDEVHLVLSTTGSQECVELAIERFGNVRIDKIIFTKLDEAAHVGTVLNVIRKVNKSLSYVTTGQDVPNDIEVGRGRKLAHMILGKVE